MRVFDQLVIISGYGICRGSYFFFTNALTTVLSTATCLFLYYRSWLFVLLVDLKNERRSIRSNSDWGTNVRRKPALNRNVKFQALRGVRDSITVL